ncbi:MAG TPA: hypothetical protein VF450_12145 [Noviherbaspirillum sp.]
MRSKKILPENATVLHLWGAMNFREWDGKIPLAVQTGFIAQTLDHFIEAARNNHQEEIAH